MCGFYRIAPVECMIVRNFSLDYNNLFSPNDYEKNDEILKTNTA